MTDDEKVGCSPDALVIGDERHGVEIKSLFPPKMIRLLMEGIDSEHRVQVLGQMWVGEFTTNDYFCYNEATPPFFKRWHRAEVADDIAKVASHVTRFCDLLDACVEKMNATGFFTKREQPATAQDQFVEQAERDLAAFIHIADVEQWKEVYAREIGYLDPERREKVLGMADYRRAFLAAGTP